MMLRCRFRSLALATICLLLPLGGAKAQCQLPESGTARATGVADARSILLDDGREILLAGIETAPSWPQAQIALAQRVAGKHLTLHGLSTQPDRYGRFTAFASVSGSETPVQYDLVREGLVRVSGHHDAAGCRSDLLALEQAARTAKVGLWSDPVYDVQKADDPMAIAAGRGDFALVEGKVRSVRESGGTIYVNFGRLWSEDFTATIPKRLESRFTAANLAPHTLAGRHVRIRGFVEERGGPWIELRHPDQIEFADLRQ